MIKLQNFRLVNVRANNNTIIYPDITFNLNEENTLIDAKNGGGKTLAVQMLFQTILPNSSFDENKTIKTLFQNVPPKTTMHSVASFKPSDSSEYNNLCLGFAVSKSQELFNELTFFNYIIEGNNLSDYNLSIDTLKLVSNDKVIAIPELKRLLQETYQKNTNTLKITIFENKLEEYSEYLKKFDINSQVFKFIMNINQTENYIQQYFEKNCSTQQGLLTEFIIPNTISALDEKKTSLKNSSEDDISILAQSLLEKSKSLSELRSIETELEEYQKIIDMVDCFMATLKSNRQDFTKYQKFLNEYSKQYANFSNDIKSLKDRLSNVSQSIDDNTEKIQSLDEKIEYLLTRKTELDVIDIQSKLSKSEKYYIQCQNNTENLQNKLNNMLAINSIVEYKNIENTLLTLHSSSTDIINDNISSYANTIQDICNMQVKKTNYEMDYVQDKISQMSTELFNCTQNIGKLKNMATICEDNIRDWSENLNDQLVSIENIQNEISGFKKYGNSLLESEELFAIVDNIKEFQSKLDTLNDEKNSLNLNISIEKNSIELIEKSIEKYSSIVQSNIDSKQDYEKDVKSLKSELGVEEFEFENKYNDFKARQLQINMEISKLSEEVEVCKDNISTMKKYGLLREKRRYDALELLQNDLETACFGSEVLQGIGNIKLLEKYPALAEVVIVSDKDYQDIKNGKKVIAEEILKENFVIMPYNTIRNINKLTFSEMLFLTRDANYYKSMMDINSKIESCNQKILSNKYQIEKLHTEYDNIQILCNRIITHVSMYSFDVVQQINTILEENTSTLNGLKSQLEDIKKSLTIHLNSFDECTKNISILEEDLSSANNKKILLDELIQLISDSHKNQISITNEKKKLSSYCVDIKDTELELSSIQSKIASLQSDFDYQKDSISLYKTYLAEVKNYTDTSVKGIKEKNLDLLIQQFRALKNTSNFNTLDIVQPMLSKVLDNIKLRNVFTKVDFNTIYKTSENIIPFDRITIEKCKSDLRKAERLLKDQSAFMIAQNNSLEIFMNRFDNRLNAEDIQYDEYRNYSIEDVENALDNICDEKNTLNERLKTLLNQKQELELLYNENLVQCELYKFFCLEKNLDINSSAEKSKKINFQDMHVKYTQFFSEYKSALNEVNNSIKKISSGVDSLKISENIKYTIKNNSIAKQNYSDILAFADKLKNLKSQAEAMTHNLKTTIENIGRIDEDISEQLYRILTEILDEASVIPKISKCKIGDGYKETFKINLYQGGKGCRFAENRIKNSIRKYVIDLAKDISTKSYDKYQIRELLSIDKIIRFGIDMNKLDIQILKIDQEKTMYQNWENVIASTGQEYIMYVMFTVTMIKYFNSVMGNSNKSPLFIFLDNPFASASDVQLWQPVRKFLDKNDAQLLCLAHNVPSVGQILFERQIILEQSRNEDNKLITSIRNEKNEVKENTQLSFFDHLEIV